MGATLVRRGDRFRWKREAWDVVLDLAKQFGWVPTGTRPPRGVWVAEWNADDYSTCGRQQVTEADALALAAALGRALAVIPKDATVPPPEGASPELAFFTGYTRGGLADFAKYCKRGAFRITDDVYDE
jgi:hypothetical protein